MLRAYETATLVRVSPMDLETLSQAAKAEGLRFEERPDDALILLPGRSIDVRRDKPRKTVDELAGSPGKKILLVAQLIGPPSPDWTDRLERAGGRLVQYLPHNAYLIVARPAAVNAIARQEFVQWIDLLHADTKPNDLAMRSGTFSGVVALVPAEGYAETLEVLRGLDATTTVLSLSDADQRAYVQMDQLTERAVADMLNMPLVLGVFAKPEMELSDGRQVLGLTPNTTFNSVTRIESLNAGDYKTWLEQNCSVCSSLSNFRVSVADTGVDGGMPSKQHPDLTGRVLWPSGSNFVSYEGPEDRNGHGTMVAGIIAGNGLGTGMADSLGYYLGHGVAPSATIVSTKIADENGVRPSPPLPQLPPTIFDFATSAILNGAYIQNQSSNDYFAGQEGMYSPLARLYDIAVRDADNNPANGNTPITLVISAGNVHQGDPSVKYVEPPATAKNVIAVGLGENWRPDWNAGYTQGEPWWNLAACWGASADSLRSLSADGRRGTVEAAPAGAKARIKPDLVAPSTMIVSPRSRHYLPTAGLDQKWCNSKFDETLDANGFMTGNYIMSAGTSFAAPVASGAALLASRVYSPSPSSARPSLLKAMLVAGAFSMKGGIDDFSGGTTIGARASIAQGFGRVNLEKIVSSSPSRKYVNESTTFTASLGAPWQATYTVDNPAKPVVVALAWSDAAAAENASVALVNNLDLMVSSIVSGTCRTYIGNAIGSNDLSTVGSCTFAPIPDTRNNVELITFLAVAGQTFTVRVSPVTIAGKADLTRPTNNQDFGLFVYNAR